MCGTISTCLCHNMCLILLLFSGLYSSFDFIVTLLAVLGLLMELINNSFYYIVVLRPLRLLRSVTPYPPFTIRTWLWWVENPRFSFSLRFLLFVAFNFLPSLFSVFALQTVQIKAQISRHFGHAVCTLQQNDEVRTSSSYCHHYAWWMILFTKYRILNSGQ